MRWILQELMVHESGHRGHSKRMPAQLRLYITFSYLEDPFPISGAEQQIDETKAQDQ